MKRASIIAFITVSMFFMACASEKGQGESNKKNGDVRTETAISNAKVPSLPIPSDSFLISQVETNLTGLNNEDLAWAMEPLHMSSPYMLDPEYHIRGAFLVYEITFDLVSVDIEMKSDTACVAKVVHDSRNSNERDYQPQRSVQRYTWKPEGDQWKIWKMEVLGSTPL